MEQENTTSEIKSSDEKSPLHKVTPLSKYLAMILFILLPFLGGYIGYTFAPEKAVEVEKVTAEPKAQQHPYKEMMADAPGLLTVSITGYHKTKERTVARESGVKETETCNVLVLDNLSYVPEEEKLLRDYYTDLIAVRDTAQSLTPTGALELNLPWDEIPESHRERILLATDAQPVQLQLKQKPEQHPRPPVCHSPFLYDGIIEEDGSVITADAEFGEEELIEIEKQALKESDDVVAFTGYHTTKTQNAWEQTSECHMLKLNSTFDDPQNQYHSLYENDGNIVPVGFGAEDGALLVSLPWDEISSGEKEQIVASSKNNPVTLELQHIPPLGMGAPLCYSKFRYGGIIDADGDLNETVNIYGPADFFANHKHEPSTWQIVINRDLVGLVSADITWGDGTTESISLERSSTRIEHAYTEPGSYTIEVSIVGPTSPFLEERITAEKEISVNEWRPQ